MRFFMISDLHLEEQSDSIALAKYNINLLASKIRNEVYPNEDILFIVLGDVCNRGNKKGYEIAKGLLDNLIQNLSGFNVRFDFIPGNHDVVEGNLECFDNFIHTMGADYSYMQSAAVSREYGGVNFIFADSTLTRKHNEPGKLALDAIQLQIKDGMQNVLFCHHALTHRSEEDNHLCVTNGKIISAELRKMGIEFYFHSHTHACDITQTNDRVSEIGCGSISKNVKDMPGVVYNQFSVGGVRDGIIVGIDRWIATSDGNKEFAYESLYPQKKKFTDPEKIGKKKYDDVPKPHIVREIVLESKDSSFHENNWLEELVNKSIEIKNNDNKLKSTKKLTLEKVIGEKGRILLAGDAGDGKTIALKKLACDLYDTLYFPVFYYLKDYTGEEICNIILKDYINLNPNRLVLIFDGYDEIQEKYRQDFEGKLNAFLEEEPAVRVIISARKNFCKKTENSKSSTLRNFDIYNLKQIFDEDIIEYLSESEIEQVDFSKAVESSRVGEMIYTPFYLEGLTRIFLAEKTLPSKKDVMEKMIERRFLNDDEKFSNIVDLNEKKTEHFSCLEKVAFAMQLMHINQINNDEYQEIMGENQRKLIKPSGLFSFSNGVWEFAHNNFREYLAAKHLAKMPVEEALKYCCVENEVKPTWANTFGYILGLSDDAELKNWAVENACETLVKYNPDSIDKSERFEILKWVFEQYELNHTYSYEGVCSESELAEFACEIRGINYLIEKICIPANKISLHNALRILQHLPKTCGKQKSIRECLLIFCKGYPQNSSYDCRCAIHAICHLELYNSDVTKQLMNFFDKSEDDFIRTGMYEYLVYTNEQDNYVQFFLDGIRFIGRHDGKRIGNESWALVEGLKSMSSADSISLVLEWFYKSDNISLYEGDCIFRDLVSKCSKLYLGGNHKLFDILYECWIWAAKNARHKEASAVSKFFKDTNSYEKAVLKFVDSEGLKSFYNWAYLNSYPEIFDILEHLYKEDKLPDRNDFAEFVRCNCVGERYNKLARTIFEVEGKTLPELPPPVDYEKERRHASLEYLSCLFDIVKYRTLIDKLILETGNENITAEELGGKLINRDFNSAITKAQFAVRRRLLPQQQIKDFFKLVNWQEFLVDEIYSLIKNDNLQLNDIPKDVVIERVKTECINGLYDGAVSSDGSFSEHVCNVTRFLVLLNIPLPQSELSKLTAIPWFGFSNKDSGVKFKYLESKFSKNVLIKQLVDDVQNNLVDSHTLEHHIDYLRAAKCEDIADDAKEICLNQEQYEGLRCSAVKYLHDLFGSDYIECEILPHCDRDMVICIAQMFKDNSREDLKSAMEREYCRNPDTVLQAYLISFNSETALKDYLESVRKENSVPNADENIIGGTTGAISGVNDYKLIPLLEELAEIVLEPDFNDREIDSLSNSIYKAYVNCVKNNPQCVLRSVDNLLNISKTEKDFTFCKRLKKAVLDEAIKIQDAPSPLKDVKAILSGGK